MKAKSLIFAAVAMMMAAACTTDQQDAFKASLTVSGAKDNTISVSADAKDVNVSVIANVSWSVSSSAAWITVDPANVTISDKAETTTKVKISVAANSDETAGREATVTFGADGVDAVAILVKQDAKAHEAKTLEVFDVDKFEAIENYSIEAEGMGGAFTFVLNADCDFTSECPEWITLDPAQNTYDGENSLITVTATIAANDGDAREGNIVFKGEDGSLTIPVSQAEAIAIDLTAMKVGYRNAFINVDVPENISWMLVYANDKTYQSYGTDGLADYLVSKLQKYVTDNAAYYTADELIEMLCNFGPVEDYEIDELEGETTYHVVAVGVACADGETVTKSTLPGHVEFTTNATPIADAAYAGILGSYTVDAYNYFDSADDTVAHYSPLPMTIEELDINETVLVTFPAEDYFPISSTGVADSFIATYDAENGQIHIENNQLSQLDYNWNYDSLGNCGISLDFGYWYAEEGEADPSTLDLTWSEDYNSLTASATPESARGDEDLISLESSIISSDGESTGYASGIAILTDPVFTRVEESSSAVASASNGIKGLKTIKAASAKRFHTAK